MEYVLQARPHMLVDLVPLQFDLWIIAEHGDTPVLEAVIDWQDGLMIFQTEDIDPDQWTAIAEQITLGMREARQRMGDQWTNGEP